MSKSIKRVKAAADAAGLDAEILRMPRSTRSAEEAAAACGCETARIVKSMIYQGRESGKLVLLLMSGAHRVDPDLAAEAVGEALMQAEAETVRRVTGFAIGGVAPIGHLTCIDCWIDKTLLDFRTVWAAAGAPDAVFEAEPRRLAAVAGAIPASLGKS